MSLLPPAKVAVFFDQLIKAGGGYQQALNAVMLVKQLPKEIVISTVFTTSQLSVATFRLHGVDSVFLPLPIFSRLMLKARRWITHSRLLELWTRFAGLNRLERCFAQHEIDLVYFVSPTPLANDLEHLNFITTVWDLCHRDDVEFPEVRAGRIFEERELLYRSILPKATAIIVESVLGKSNVMRRYGIDDDRCHVMPLTPAVGTQVTEEQYQASYIDVRKKYQLDTPYIYYPAQFWAHKNHAYVLEGLKILEQRFGKVVGAIFSGGDQGNLEYVKRVTESLNLSHRIRFIGFVPNEEIPYLYRQSLALVMPTYFGPTNLPPLEAFSLGVPVLYPDKKGLREQVKGAALLLDLLDPTSMAIHLTSLIDDPLLRDDLVKKGRVNLLGYSDTGRLRTLESIFRDFQRRRVAWG